MFTGPATITFAGASITHADNCEIVLSPGVVMKADVLGSQGVLTAMCPTKGIAVNVQEAEMGTDSFSRASGYNGNVNEVGSARVLNLDTSIVTLPEGSAAIAWTRPDGMAMRLFLKRAICVPQSQSVKLSNQSFSEFTYQLLMVDPGDNSHIGGTFEEGDAT